VNEQLRLRTAKDMSALETMLMAAGLGNWLSLSSSSSVSAMENGEKDHSRGLAVQGSDNGNGNGNGIANPVALEFRAFRRLLFMDEAAAGSSGTAGSRSLNANAPPTRSKLMALPYIGDLRPSTLLGHLISCAPPQLPSPSTANANALAGADLLQDYVERLTTIPPSLQTHSAARPSLLNRFPFPSVASLYSSGAQPNLENLGDSAQATPASTLSAKCEWRTIVAEASSWEDIQASLDVFVQRAAVADNAQQKQQMRTWYEALQDIGGSVFESK
jgi:hypothetical protein